MLINIDSKKNVFAIGAAIFKKPVGLVYSSMDPQTYTGSIETLYVLEKYRNQGIGSTLMEMIEKLLVEKGCKRFQIEYRKPINMEESVIEKIIKKTGWENPQATITFFKLKDWQGLLNESWMSMPIPPSCQIFYWRDLSDEEIRLLKEEEKGLSMENGYFSPFIKEDFDPDTSLGLRYNGKIAGWIITRRLPNEVILFAIICIKKEFQGLIFAPLLLAESVKKAYKKKYSRMFFTVNIKNKVMLRLSYKRFKKFSYEIKESYESRKYLHKV